MVVGASYSHADMLKFDNLCVSSSEGHSNVLILSFKLIILEFSTPQDSSIFVLPQNP